MKSSEGRVRRNPELTRVSKVLIGLGVSITFVWLTLRGVDLVEVQSRLQQVELGALLPVFISLAVIFLYKAFRWQYQMSTLKQIAFGRMFSAIVIGYMANNAVPLRGGDLLRAHVLARQENIGTAAVFATVAVERILDMASLVTLSLVVLLMIPLPDWMLTSMIILGTTLLGGIAGIMTLRRRPILLETWWERGCSRISAKMQEILSASIKQVRFGLETASGKLRLTNQYILAVGEWILWGLLVNYSLRAAGIQLSMAAIMSTVIATNLAVMLPAAPGYIGVFHYAVMTTLVFYHFDKSIAFSGAVILHAIFVIPVSFVGMMLFMREWLALRNPTMRGT